MQKIAGKRAERALGAGGRRFESDQFSWVYSGDMGNASFWRDGYRARRERHVITSSTSGPRQTSRRRRTGSRLRDMSGKGDRPSSSQTVGHLRKGRCPGATRIRRCTAAIQGQSGLLGPPPAGQQEALTTVKPSFTIANRKYQLEAVNHGDGFALHLTTRKRLSSSSTSSRFSAGGSETRGR